MRSVIVALLLVMITSRGWGEVFQWEDTAGVIHFTDSLEKVPPAYRSKAKPREVDPLPGYRFPASQENPPPRPPSTDTGGGQEGGTPPDGTDRAALEKERDRLQQEVQAAHRRYVISLGMKEKGGSALNTIAIRRKEYHDLQARLAEVEEKLKSLTTTEPTRTLP